MTRVVERYEIHDELARGGMGSVHLARFRSDAGFSRTIAIKCISPLLAGEDAFARMFADEARASSRITHSNVVSVLDVIERRGELFLVMDYCAGESLSSLWRLAVAKKERIPYAIASSIFVGMLQGLHAAHETGVVHRDVSPQNILVGADGVARVVDFGIAKAKQRLQPTTHVGDLKGKLGYLAPETVRSQPATPRTDLYAAGVMLWEVVTGERMFDSGSRADVLEQIAIGLPTPPSAMAPDLPEALEAVILEALATDPAQRFESARAMALALASAAAPATATEVAAWVESLAHEPLAKRAALVAAVEAMPPAVTAEDTVIDNAVATDGAAAPIARPRQSRLLLPALLGAAAIIGALVAVRFRPHASSRAQAAAPSPPSVSSSVPVVVENEEPSPPEPPTVPTSTGSVNRPRRPPHAVVHSRCDSPTYIDHEGKTRYKVDCL